MQKYLTENTKGYSKTIFEFYFAKFWPLIAIDRTIVRNGALIKSDILEPWLRHLQRVWDIIASVFKFYMLIFHSLVA